MLQVRIRIKGHIDRNWSDSLARLDVTNSPDGTAVLSGVVRDQAALYGVLSQLCNLGIRLVSFSSEDGEDLCSDTVNGPRT